MANRPGAASAMLATLWAKQAGDRVYAGMIAVPRRNRGSHAAAIANGVKPSAPSDSADQMSEYPMSANSVNRSRCVCR